jgi:Tfp pilus assembly protein PilF
MQLGQPERADEIRRRGDEAAAHFARVVELTRRMLTAPGDADLRYETGMIFMAEGLTREGVAWLETALRCDANHQKAHAALAEHYERTADGGKAEFHRRRAAGAAGRREREVSTPASS